VEEALENKPILKETIGGILGIFIPLHIRLKDIDSVHMNETGKVTINLPYRRHITIQLESKHAGVRESAQSAEAKSERPRNQGACYAKKGKEKNKEKTAEFLRAPM